MFSNFTYNSYSAFVNLFGRNMGACKKNYSKNWGWKREFNKLWEALNAVVEVWTLFSALEGWHLMFAWYFLLMPLCVCVCVHSYVSKSLTWLSTHTHTKEKRKYQATTMCQSPKALGWSCWSLSMLFFMSKSFPLHFECPCPSLQWLVCILSIDSWCSSNSIFFMEPCLSPSISPGQSQWFLLLSSIFTHASVFLSYGYLSTHLITPFWLCIKDFGHFHHITISFLVITIFLGTC